MKILAKNIKELQDVTITHVSYVKRGANKKTFFLSKSEEPVVPDVEFDVKVIRNDTGDKQLLYGVVYEPMEIDTHGDMMKASEIEKMAHEFMTHYRNIDVEHNLIAGAGQVVESYITLSDTEISEQSIKKGSWVLVTKATDEIWNDYLNGEITGYSMYGIARNSITKTEPEISKFQKFMEKTGIIKSFTDTVNDTIENLKSNPYFIMDMVYEDFWKTIDWDMANNEQLEVLRDSLKEASVYIDGLLSARIMKSQEPEELESNTDTESEQKPEPEPETNIEPEIDNAEPKTDEVPVSCSDTEPEPVEPQALTPEHDISIDDVKKSVQIVKTENEELKTEIQELKKTLNEKETQIEKLMVKSNYRMQNAMPVIEEAKAKFF